MTIPRVFGEGTILNYRVMVDQGSSNGTVDYPTENGVAAPRRNTPIDVNKVPFTPFSQVAPQDLDSQLNRKYTFETFFEGVSNKLARTAGEAIANDPGKTTFNP